MKRMELRWLFSGKGNPTAFVYGGFAFLPDGDLLGKLLGREIWNLKYVGEIFDGNRLVRRLYRPLGSMEELAGWAAPPMPSAPAAVDEIQLPSDMRELELGLDVSPPAPRSISML